jgi:putative heme iron utilization protein
MCARHRGMAQPKRKNENVCKNQTGRMANNHRAVIHSNARHAARRRVRVYCFIYDRICGASSESNGLDAEKYFLLQDHVENAATMGG